MLNAMAKAVTTEASIYTPLSGAMSLRCSEFCFREVMLSTHDLLDVLGAQPRRSLVLTLRSTRDNWSYVHFTLEFMVILLVG